MIREAFGVLNLYLFRVRSQQRWHLLLQNIVVIIIIIIFCQVQKTPRVAVQ
jgi:hypothetical protein